MIVERVDRGNVMEFGSEAEKVRKASLMAEGIDMKVQIAVMLGLVPAEQFQVVKERLLSEALTAIGTNSRIYFHISGAERLYFAVAEFNSDREVELKEVYSSVRPELGKAVEAFKDALKSTFSQSPGVKVKHNPVQYYSNVQNFKARL